MTHFPLRQLEAEMHKTVAVTTDEIETEEGDCKGMYVWRDSDGDKYFWSPTPVRYSYKKVSAVSEADNVKFLCPLCFERNNGPVVTHSVMVSLSGRNVPDEAGSRNGEGKPSRWEASGTTLDDLVLTPSIALNASNPPNVGCHWHGFVGSNGIPPGHAG